MTDYVTAADIWEMLLNFGVGPTPRVDDDQVEEHIDGIEGSVNGILATRGYSPIPATNAEAKAVIRENVRKKVAVTVFLELNQPQHSPDWARSWDIDFDAWMNRLRLGQEKLPGGVEGPPGDVVISSFSLNLTEVEES
jgi:hypothetical protein